MSSLCDLEAVISPGKVRLTVKLMKHFTCTGSWKEEFLGAAAGGRWNGIVAGGSQVAIRKNSYVSSSGNLTEKPKKKKTQPSRLQ